MKTCTKCGDTKPLDAFGKHKLGAGGLRPRCRVCHNAESKAWKDANYDRHIANNRRWKDENRERHNANTRAWAEANAQRKAETNRAWLEANRQRKAETNRAWRKANAGHVKKMNAAWKQANKGKVLAYTRKRQTAAMRALPRWADISAITAVYERAAFLRSIGVDVHVDHIVPLQGATVCGLHVHWNLEIVPAVDNIRKGNRLDEAVAPIAWPEAA